MKKNSIWNNPRLTPDNLRRNGIVFMICGGILVILGLVFIILALTSKTRILFLAPGNIAFIPGVIMLCFGIVFFVRYKRTTAVSDKPTVPQQPQQ